MRECIKVNNIWKSYEENKVLKNVSFSVKKGEMLAILGKSGSGKSTLLHILAGIEKADRGEYFLDGIEMHMMSDRRLAKIRNTEIGYVMQSFGLISAFTAYENIIIPLQINKLLGNVISERLENIAKELHITELLNKKVCLLSGGEKQRVAIARALICEPSVILADEPTGALDGENRDEICKIFKMLSLRGSTVIIVTHDKEVAEKCNRSFNMEDISGGIL